MKRYLPILAAFLLSACDSQRAATVGDEDMGGVGSGGAPDLGPFSSAPVCTSAKMWANGDRGSQLMHPGVACIDCHDADRRAPTFQFAGTVYPTAHEPDDCNGIKGGAKVILTDANGKDTTATVNSAGNFFYESSAALALPFTAKVVTADGKERKMVDAQMSGDCNSCHTQDGAEKAPGRILLPN